MRIEKGNCNAFVVGERDVEIINDNAKCLCIDGVQGSEAGVDIADLDSVSRGVDQMTRQRMWPAQQPCFFGDQAPGTRWVEPTNPPPKSYMAIIFTNVDEYVGMKM
jgi:hypothetical protein